MRIGFACKVMDPESLQNDPKYCFKTTTLKHLRSLSEIEATRKIVRLVHENLEKLNELINLVRSYPEGMRMLRLSGDLLPLATHPDVQDMYIDSLRQTIREYMPVVGDKARLAGVRLSFHPGQFTVLGSENSSVVSSSINELEYHAQLFELMGYSSRGTLGHCINIHAGSKKVPLSVLRSNIARLSEVCRGFLTIENDEFSYCIQELVDGIGDVVPIVPDLHHEWIYSGDYVQAGSSLMRSVEQTWGGARPKLHCAMSRREYFTLDVCNQILPNLASLKEQGLKRSQLRQHSDTIWHSGLREYYRSFADTFDIMVEAKHKQLASYELFRYFNQGESNAS